MIFAPVVFLEALAVALALSIDTFAAGFAYGSGNIKIPMLSVQIISVLCSAILGVSLFLGSILRPYIPAQLTTAICFATLLALGVIKLLDSAAKSIIRKHSNLKKEIKFSMFSFKFILKLYADPEAADVDASRIISPAEAASLAVALSLDGLAVGFGATLGNINGPAVFLCSLVANLLGMVLGCWSGSKLARKTPFNLSWLSGVMLIAMAVLRLF